MKEYDKSRNNSYVADKLKNESSVADKPKFGMMGNYNTP